MNKSFFLAALMAAASVPVMAQKTKAQADTLRSIDLQEVQVVSTRATKKTPMAFMNMSKDDIKAVNYGQDVPYLLSLTPSVTMTSDAGNGIGYTSLRVRGTDPSRINITANGIPMNDAESSSLFWVNFGDFASSAQSIQIQRGVGTSTNGPGAFGATVNMLTENVGTTPFIGLDLSGGSYYSHKETLRFGTGLINGHWGIQGRLSNIGSKGYLDRASTKLNSYFIQGGYFGDNTVVKFITFNGQEETYHAWNYTSKYEQALFGRTYNSCGEYYTADGQTRYYDNQTDHYHSQNYQLIWNQRLGTFMNLNAALHYTRGDGYYEEYKVNKNLEDYGLSTYKYKTDLIRRKQMGNDFYGAIASLNFDNKKGFVANIGGGWNKYDGDHFGNVLWVQENSDVEVTPDFEYYRDNAKKTDFNIYGKATYEFAKGLSGYLDLQYRNVGYKMQNPEDDWWGTKYTNDYSYVINKSYNFFNPKFGLNYDITRNHKVYLSYAITHKEPVRNNFENYYNATTGGDLAMKEPVPERLNDLELGYKYQSPTFAAGLNFYYMNYKNQFVLTGELDAIGEAKTSNLDNSYRLGVEGELSWKPVDFFQWDVNATWSRNRVKNMTVLLDDYVTTYTINGETPLSFSPDLILNNIFTFKYKGFKGSIQSQYVSDQYLNNTGFKEYETLDDNMQSTRVSMMLKHHFNTNIDLSYTFSAKKLGLKDVTAGITMYNIFSAKYDNNGWSYCAYQLDNGQLRAVNYTYDDDGNINGGDQYEAGFAPSAPFNVMAHLSLNF